MTYTVRRARAGDAAEFLRLVEELARFEKLDPPDEGAKKRLAADAFTDPPAFELLVAQADGQPGLVGYAIALRTYSSFLAKPTLYLEDLYLSPAHRGAGLADRFMGALAELALSRGWGRIEGIVLEWNARARAFYARTGARELADWRFFRYDEDAIGRLAASSK